MKILLVWLLIVIIVFFMYGVLKDRGFVQPKESTVVEAVFPVLSMDYDPESNALYYIQSQKDKSTLFRYDLQTGQQQVLHTQSPHAVGWVSVSNKGTVYVLDVGDNPFDLHWNVTLKPPAIIELRDTTVVKTLPVLTKTMLFERSGQEKKTKESIAAGCRASIEESSSQTPLGIRRQISHKEAHPFVARFLVLTFDSGPDVVLNAEDRGVEILQQSHHRLFSDNLSKLNPTVFPDTEEDGEAVVIDKQRDFAFRSVPKAFAFIYGDLRAQKYYDQVVWGNSKMNMGSAAQSIMGIPQSHYVFTPDGDFIYHKWSRICKLSKP